VVQEISLEQAVQPGSGVEQSSQVPGELE